jgi:hypothetical protein
MPAKVEWYKNRLVLLRRRESGSSGRSQSRHGGNSGLLLKMDRPTDHEKAAVLLNQEEAYITR